MGPIPPKMPTPKSAFDYVTMCLAIGAVIGFAYLAWHHLT